MDHASSADIIVRISQNGNVTASCDEEHVPKAWNILAATKGKDSPIAHVGCLTEEQKDAIAQRLAQLIISERT